MSTSKLVVLDDDSCVKDSSRSSKYSDEELTHILDELDNDIKVHHHITESIANGDTSNAVHVERYNDDGVGIGDIEVDSKDASNNIGANVLKTITINNGNANKYGELEVGELSKDASSSSVDVGGTIGAELLRLLRNVEYMLVPATHTTERFHFPLLARANSSESSQVKLDPPGTDADKLVVRNNTVSRNGDIEVGEFQNDISSFSKNPVSDADADYGSHLGGHRQYWRDIILGVNDGLVSTFLLVATVAGGGLSTTDCLLTALGGSVAGAVSMCAGEYVATKSQNEVMEGEIRLESQHVHKYPEEELSQVNDLLQIIGITDEQKGIQNQLQNHYRQNREALLKLMIALELGFIEEEERSPAMAGFVSFFLFLLGSLPSVIPFVFINASTTSCLIAAAVSTSIALMIVGAVKTWATRGSWTAAAMENLAIAGVGGAFAYGVGIGFDQLLHG